MTDLTPQEQQAYDVVKQFEQVYTDDRIDLVDELVADDFQHHVPLDTPDGREGYKRFLRQFREACPDYTSETLEEVVSGKKVAQAYVMRGTHEGEFMEIPATGKRVEVEGISIYRVENGRITDEWAQPDIMSMMQQLGVAPTPGE